MTQEKECTAFLDGDRGGDMILNELLQVSKIKYYARAPPNKEVEELIPKELVSCLQNKRLVSDLLKERRKRSEKAVLPQTSKKSESFQIFKWKDEFKFSTSRKR